MTATEVNVSVSTRKAIPLNFNYVGEDGKEVKDRYLISPPKGYLSMSLAEKAQEAAATDNVEAIWAEVEDWFVKGLGKKQWKRLHDRLEDPDDDLDIIHLVKAMEGVIEKVVGDPTTSSSD